MTTDTELPPIRDERVPTQPAPARSADNGSTARVFGMLLKIADNYRDQNAIRQAIEMYFDLLKKYGHLPEAERARDRLVEIAEQYEARGDYRQARSLCERLL